ncbi:MAG: hypothetical protein RL591_1793, partial [Planctomycetota bacterium]
REREQHPRLLRSGHCLRLRGGHLRQRDRRRGRSRGGLEFVGQRADGQDQRRHQPRWRDQCDRPCGSAEFVGRLPVSVLTERLRAACLKSACSSSTVVANAITAQPQSSHQAITTQRKDTENRAKLGQNAPRAPLQRRAVFRFEIGEVETQRSPIRFSGDDDQRNQRGRGAQRRLELGARRSRWRSSRSSSMRC